MAGQRLGDVFPALGAMSASASWPCDARHCAPPAILDGRQPLHLTLGDLLERNIRLDWVEQRRAFGFS